jgi:hypothetical protein
VNTNTQRITSNIIILILFVILISPSRLFLDGVYQINIRDSFIGDCLFSWIDIILILFIVVQFFSKKELYIKRSSKILYVFLSILFVYITLTSFYMFFSNINYEMGYYLNAILKIFRFIWIDFIILFFMNNDQDSRTKMMYLFLISFCLLVLVAPLSLSNYDVYGSEMQRAGTLGLPPNYLGIIGSMLMIYGLLISKKNLWAIAYFCIGVYGIFLSGSRRPIGFFAVVMVLYILSIIIKYIRNFLNSRDYSFRKIIIRYFIALFVIILLCVSLGFSTSLNNAFFKYMNQSSLPLINRIININNSGSSLLEDQDRQRIYAKDFEIIKSNPLGFGGSDIYVNNFLISEGHAHNVFLQFTIMYGIIFTLLVIVGLMILIRKFWNYLRLKENEKFKRPIIFFYILLFLMLGFDLFDYSLYSSKAWYIICIVVSFIIHTKGKDPAKN